MYKGIYFLGIIFILIVSACNKNLSDVEKDAYSNLNNGNRLDFYILESFETINESLEIDETTVVISSERVIPYESIKSYNKSNRTFNVTQSVIDNLQQNANKYFRKAFALTIENKIIYTGYFWYGYASSICDRITIDPILLNGKNGLRVNLGYPGDSFTTVSTDNRNDDRIMRILQKDGKLLN